MNLPLPWTNNCLVTWLDRCFLVDIEEWHQHKLLWIQETNCPALGELCKNVYESLLPAYTKAKLLRSVFQGDQTLPHGVTGRLILSWALVDIQKAFGAFEVISTNAELAPYHIRQMTMLYLGQAYELMLLLGRMLYPPDSDICWLTESWSYLKQHNLADFEFDGPQDYKCVADPTLAGVLADSMAVPEQYLPANPGPPAYYRNQGPYGPAILRNYFATYNQDVSFIRDAEPGDELPI